MQTILSAPSRGEERVSSEYFRRHDYLRHVNLEPIPHEAAAEDAGDAVD